MALSGMRGLSVFLVMYAIARTRSRSVCVWTRSSLTSVLASKTSGYYCCCHSATHYYLFLVDFCLLSFLFGN